MSGVFRSPGRCRAAPPTIFSDNEGKTSPETSFSATLVSCLVFFVKGGGMCLLLYSCGQQGPRSSSRCAGLTPMRFGPGTRGYSTAGEAWPRPYTIPIARRGEAMPRPPAPRLEPRSEFLPRRLHGLAPTPSLPHVGARPCLALQLRVWNLAQNSFRADSMASPLHFDQVLPHPRELGHPQGLLGRPKTGATR